MIPWNYADARKDDISQLVYLSNLIGADPDLVQPGGGNTSVKLEEPDLFGCTVRALAVKGSGTDLRTIGPSGFTHLYLDRLALLAGRESLSDEEMMALMRACMLFPDRDPVPSVETPLHSLLPYRFVAHTHDVATLSLSDTPHAREHVRRIFGKAVAFLEYVRPGFPLAKRLAERFSEGPPRDAIALVMEKHGLAAWGDTAQECYERLRDVIEKAEAYVAEQSSRKRVFGPSAVAPLADAARRDLAAAVLPVIRGELARQGWRAVLYLDDSAETLEAICDERFAEVAARGVMTPEHILRAGVRPLVVNSPEPAVGAQQRAGAGATSTAGGLVAAPLHDAIREAMGRFHADYLRYAKTNGQDHPIPDYLKTIVVPGLGVICAGRDRRSALVAAACYRATMRAMAGAEAVERFEFLSDAGACEMEYWPLERRKIAEGAGTRGELEDKAAIIIGAASGIGRATAERFAAAGAHLVLVDLDLDGAAALADGINAATPERAFAAAANVADPEAVANAFREAVLRFGGIDVLFYSPGVAPELHSVAEMPDAEIEAQMAVHFRGAVAATREAARVMLEQRTGGRLIYNASKAAFVPGERAAAYGAAKAALVHYVRNAASELGRHGITANYINADAVDTPLFRALVRERAQERGQTEEETLAHYAERSVLREATVPPEAVAEAALWLASDHSAHTTGCVITVGGGAEGFPR
ncbi:MAG: SDR family oxidoreductase [Dehalococcoidia bacterium]|nr:SDR family oxidoreductase [Dehalococcoidia bacterium]